MFHSWGFESTKAPSRQIVPKGLFLPFQNREEEVPHPHNCPPLTVITVTGSWTVPHFPVLWWSFQYLRVQNTQNLKTINFLIGDVDLIIFIISIPPPSSCFRKLNPGKCNWLERREEWESKILAINFFCFWFCFGAQPRVLKVLPNVVQRMMHYWSLNQRHLHAAQSVHIRHLSLFQSLYSRTPWVLKIGSRGNRSLLVLGKCYKSRFYWFWRTSLSLIIAKGEIHGITKECLREALLGVETT